LCEQKGAAAEVLLNLGLKREDVRGEVLNLLGDSTSMVAGAAPARAVADRAPRIESPPPELTTEQLHIIREQVRRLNEQKESFVAAQDFAQAARCRDEVLALTRLLAWYEWIQK
jgi:hypothetical protein